MSKAPNAPIVFEPEFIAPLKKIFEESIAFNRVLGLSIGSITPERVEAAIAMKPELVGHYSFCLLYTSPSPRD
mgnify:CR=1 FL=1